MIDGLRAVAIGMVLLFHAGFDWFRGGFVGVDLFFVISGFLITRNIIHETSESRFALGQFYLRRIARLFPALFITIIVASIVGYFLLDPDRLKQFGASSVAAGLSVSNIFFWRTLDYFAPAATAQPLLHTWSLGVEEQFYLVWPILILSLLAARRKWVLILGLGTLGLASLLAGLYYERIDPRAVFFLTPFRVFQFALGGVLAAAGVFRGGAFASVAAATAVASLGLLGVSAGAGAATGFLVEAGGPALAGAAFILGSEARWVKKVFASAPLIWVGQRSYSIYLVHWPIGVFWMASLQRPFNLLESIAAIFASLIVGAALHKLVERPFRLNRRADLGRVLRSAAVAAASLCCVLAFGGTTWSHNGWPGRLSDDMQSAYRRFAALKEQTFTEIGMSRCVLDWEDKTLADFDQDFCAPRRLTPRGAYLIIGDSWAANTYLTFRAAYPELQFDRLSIPGCMIRPIKAFKPGELENCREIFEFAFANLVRPDRYEGIILSASWLPPYEQVSDLVKTVRDRGMRPIVVGRYVRFAGPVTDAYFTAETFAGPNYRRAYDSDRDLGETRDLEVRAQIPGAAFVRMLPVLCPAGCDAVDGARNLLYFDHSHLTVIGGKLMGERLRAAYPDLFSRRAFARDDKRNFACRDAQPKTHAPRDCKRA